MDLIAALLACSFFCLFPTANRKKHKLPDVINMDKIFASIYERRLDTQIDKMKCFTHYFERVCSSTPSGFLTFERKVLPIAHDSTFWENSVIPLCRVEVYSSRAIEDHPGGSLEVDFADESFGGIVLELGCLQEEIRFLINPELVVGMLFLPLMDEREAIEIVGAARFSNYTGYDRTFEYSGDYVDRTEVDSMGRRLRRVVAIDAYPQPGDKQYSLKFILREVNKAYCGFLDQPICQQQEHHSDIGVITGNWGCGVFGGEPEVKTAIQWLAASQASRPFMSYYTFGLEKMEKIDKVCEQIVSKRWTVGDLWKKLIEYSNLWAKRKTKLGFFSWVIHNST